MSRGDARVCLGAVLGVTGSGVRGGLAVFGGDPVGISWRCLMLIKLEWLGYRTVRKLWRYVKPFSSNTGTSRTDGQTDGRTDGQIAISLSRVSVLTRDKNMRMFIQYYLQTISQTSAMSYPSIPPNRKLSKTAPDIEVTTTSTTTHRCVTRTVRHEVVQQKLSVHSSRHCYVGLRSELKLLTRLGSIRPSNARINAGFPGCPGIPGSPLTPMPTSPGNPRGPRGPGRPCITWHQSKRSVTSADRASLSQTDKDWAVC